MKYDIIFYEAFEEEADELKKHLSPDVKAVYTADTIQESEYRELDAPVISVRTQSILPLNWHNDLNAIISRSTGYDHLLAYKKATNGDLHLGNLPLYCHRSVAEHALMLWMNLSKNYKKQTEQFNNFHRDGITGYESMDKTLFVIGVGNIGYEVVKVGRGIGMNVIGNDIVQKHEDVEYVSLMEGIEKADFVVCAMSLNPENEGILNKELFSKAKKRPFFVNISRGELSPLEDIKTLLQEGQLKGAALDVYDKEKELAEHLRSGDISSSEYTKMVAEMVKNHNVIFTPHNAFNTHESVVRKSKQSIEQYEHLLETGCLKWSVSDK